MSVPTSPPEGFEFTGEFRPPALNEWFWSDAINGARRRDTKSVLADPRIILRKKIDPFERIDAGPFTVACAPEIGVCLVVESSMRIKAYEARALAGALVAAADYLDLHGEQ